MKNSLSETLSGSGRFAPWLLVLFSTIFTVAAYLQAWDAPFVSDDNFYLTGNSRLAGLQFTELWRLFYEPYNPYEFLPLRDLSYWFDISLFGLNPAAFRIHNIILYLLCVPLVYAVTTALWRYFRPADESSTVWIAAVVTSLFVLHPAHVEAVVWISGRKDLLSALFSLLGLWFAIKARHGFPPRYVVATLIALLAALLSKATAVAVAPIIALLWMFFWRDIPVQERQRALLLWPASVMLLAGLSILYFSAGQSVGAPHFLGVEVLTRALSALGGLARLAVSPESRHFYYPGLDDPNLGIMVACGAVLAIIAAISAVILLRRRSLAGFAVIAFVLLCIPYLQLMPYVTTSLVSDRFLTLALWPVMMLIVALAWRFKPLLRIVSLLIVALLWGLQTVERPRDWNDFEVLVELDERAYPGYYMPLIHKVNAHLSHRSFREAQETASAINFPELRNVVYGLIQADHAVLVSSVETGRPDAALAIMKRLEYVLGRPPIQIKWDPPVQSFWGICQNRLTLQWQALAGQFPGDASVQEGAQAWISYMAR